MSDSRQRLLFDLLGPDLASAFTWQTEILSDEGPRIQCYQHSPTRRFLYAAYDRSVVGFTTSDAVHILAAGTSIREVVADWRGLVPEPEIDVELPDSFVRFADAMFDLEES